MPPREPARPPVPSPKQRRRILSGAVEDNVRAIENRPSGRLYRRPPVSWPVVGTAVALVVAGVALWLALGPLAEYLTAPPQPVRTVARPGGAGSADAGPDADLPRIAGEVLPLTVQRIVLDPGHGGGDLGTRTSLGLTEKELTLDLALRVGALLSADGFDVGYTRRDDRRVSLRDRAEIANERNADLFVSIHVNWLEDGRANRGIETYYLGPTDDPFLVRLASDENRESGYSLADARRLLDSIYADLRRQQSRAFASAVQRYIVRAARSLGPEVRDRGVKSAPFLVLVGTEMPAILAEVASLSSLEEARQLARDDYRERLAVALRDGIRAYSESIAGTNPPTENR